MTDADDMSDTEMWREVKKRGQEKRANNREDSAKLLTEAGIQFESKNGGAHLVVQIGRSASDRKIDFWPGTGLWMWQHTKSAKQRNYGVRNLIHLIKGKR